MTFLRVLRINRILGIGLSIHLRHHGGYEILFLLFDTRANFEALETQHSRAGSLEQLLDRLIRILDERLTHERDFVERLAQPPLDHLRDDLRALALVPGRLAQDLALFGDDLRWHLAGIDVA